MTPYSARDLDGWEFKIIRSATGRFHDPFWQRAVLQEEARAGWMLLEKFDNYRLRLKRPVSAREKDAALGFDPYRTWVGIGPVGLALWIVVGILAGVAFVTGVLVAAVGR